MMQLLSTLDALYIAGGSQCMCIRNGGGKFRSAWISMPAIVDANSIACGMVCCYNVGPYSSVGYELQASDMSIEFSGKCTPDVPKCVMVAGMSLCISGNGMKLK